jgi:hypothetical protein
VTNTPANPNFEISEIPAGNRQENKHEIMPNSGT